MAYAAVALLSGLHGNAQAADYIAGFSLRADGTHDDNFLMSASDPLQMEGAIASPAIALGVDTETSHLGLDSRVDLRRYDDSDYNSDDITLAVSATKRLERSNLGLDAQVIYDSTITSELLDSGRIGRTAQRSKLYMLGPSWRWLINEKNVLVVSGQYAVRGYDGPGYVGYKNGDGTVEYSYALTARWQLNLVAQYSRYRSDSVTIDVPARDTPFPGLPILIGRGQFGQQTYRSESSSRGGQLGASYVLSESTSLRLLVGSSRSETSYQVDDPLNICADTLAAIFAPLCAVETGTSRFNTAQLEWKWTGERHQAVLNATQSQQPSSNGTAIEATRLSASWSYRVSELDQLSLSVAGTRNRLLKSNRTEEFTAFTDRDYISATLAYSRQFSESWYVEASYGYRYQDYRTVASDATSNVFNVGLRYSPLARHWSR